MGRAQRNGGFGDNVGVGAIGRWLSSLNIPPELRKQVGDIETFRREIPIKDVLVEIHGQGALDFEKRRAALAAMDMAKGASTISLETVVHKQQRFEADVRRGYDHCLHEWACTERYAQALVRSAVLGRLKQQRGAPLS